MRQIWITKKGGPDVLQIREAPDPIPRAGEVRVRTKAIGINHGEAMIRMGVKADAETPKTPCVVGWEVAGVVDGGDGFPIGTRVLGLSNWGGYADLICLPKGQVRAVPDDWTFEEAAAFPVAYLTAYQLLSVVAAVRPGSKVLVHGAAGMVGLAAAQLGREFGCVMYGTASSAKHEVARKHGYAHLIDYRKDDFVAAAKELTGGLGVDAVLDPIGGGHWRRSYEALAPTGKLVAYGFSGGATGHSRNLLHMAREFLKIPRYSPLGLMPESKGVLGSTLGHLWKNPALLGRWLDEIVAMARANKLRPVVDKSFPFDEVAAAHGYVEDARQVGKVVLRV